MEKKIINQFVRDDGIVFKPDNFNNEIQEEWILKQVPVKTGEGEDDWIMVSKPVKLGETNIQKQIHEQAKGTDLKSLIQMVIRTGDDTIINQREGSYCDISDIPNDESLIAIKRNEAVKKVLSNPDKIGDTELKDILGSKEAFDTYIKGLLESDNLKDEVKPEVKSEASEKKEGN